MNNIHAERVETLVVVVCSPFAIPPHRATALFSVSPQLLLTEPPLSSPHHPHLLLSPPYEPPLSIPVVQRATDELVSLVPSYHRLIVSSSLVVASLHSLCMMLKRSSVSSLLTSTVSSTLQGLFLFFLCS